MTPTGEAELIVGQHEPRSLRPIHFLQGDDVGIQLASVAGKCVEIARRALEARGDVTGDAPFGACRGRTLRNAVGLQQTKLRGRDQPFEIPRRELEARRRRSRLGRGDRQDRQARNNQASVQRQQ